MGRQGVSSGVGREGVSSTVGREGRCPSQGIRKCWFGSTCKYQFCPFWHPRFRRIAARLVESQKFVGTVKEFGVTMKISAISFKANKQMVAGER